MKTTMTYVLFSTNFPSKQHIFQTINLINILLPYNIYQQVNKISDIFLYTNKFEKRKI